MSITLRTAIVGAGLALGAACTDIDSESLLTSGMSAHITATATGDGDTTVAAVLRAGDLVSNVFVDLSEGDTLTATRGEEALSLARESVGSYHRYVARFDGDTPDVDHVVALARTVDEGAPNSVVALPEAFTVSGPTEFSRAGDLAFTWEPSGTAEAMYVWVDGPCVFSYGESIIGDPGEWTIPGGTIEPLEDDPEASCNVSVRVTRTRLGQLDAGFGEGGLVEGVQSREFGATSNP